MQKKVVFLNSKGYRLSGLLTIPQEEFKGLIVIFAHGLGSSKTSTKYQDFTNILIDKNIGTFTFDFFGHGESEGQFEDLTIAQGVDDVTYALRFLKKSGFTKIGLVGTSFGGICSIMAASQTAELVFLGLLVPISIPEGLSPFRSGDGVKLKNPLNKDYLNNGHKVANKIKIPVYIIHGDQDKIVPIKQSQDFCKLLPNCTLEIIKGGNHHLRNLNHYKKVLNLMTDFILKMSQS